MSDQVVVLKNISKHYEMDSGIIEVIREASLIVNKGDFTSIIGRSGSGKSTLLNLVGCLDKPSSGNISVTGKEINSLNESQMAELRGTKMGFIFQSFNLIGRSSVQANVEAPMIYRGVSAKQRAYLADSVLDSVNMFDRRKHFPSQLSGGQQQRVAIARALVNKPEIILADEPTGALDNQNASEVMEIFRNLANSGTSVIVVTHDMEVAKVSDAVLTMSDGVLKSSL